MVEIEFINKTAQKIEVWEVLTNNLFNSAFELLKIRQMLTVSVFFINSDEAKKINKQYRNKEYIPDVLSFPSGMTKKDIRAIGFYEIGDLFICIDEAKNKSLKYDHTIEQEVAFLLVHGFLHLLGYDHETSIKDEKKMFKLQDKILNTNGIEYTIKFKEDDYIREGL